MKKRALILVPFVMAGCGSLPSELGGSSSSSSSTTSGPLIPEGALQLTSNLSVSMAQIATVGVALIAIKLIYDPLAPNWEIKEEKLSDDTYRFDLRMKRYHTGGQGEAMKVLRRRADVLQRKNGYKEFQLLEFSEGIDSKTLGANRYAEAKIKLIGREKVIEKPVEKATEKTVGAAVESAG